MISDLSQPAFHLTPRLHADLIQALLVGDVIHIKHKDLESFRKALNTFCSITNCVIKTEENLNFTPTHHKITLTSIKYNS